MAENKEKKVVLMLTKKFFAKHISASKNTNFQKHLESGKKIHTIRSNYDMWKHDIEKINNGGFVLSIRQWENKPYRSKQEEIVSHYRHFVIRVNLGCGSLRDSGKHWIQ